MSKPKLWVDKEEVAELFRLREAGKKWEDIAKHFGEKYTAKQCQDKWSNVKYKKTKNNTNNNNNNNNNNTNNNKVPSGTLESLFMRSPQKRKAEDVLEEAIVVQKKPRIDSPDPIRNSQSNSSVDQDHLYCTVLTDTIGKIMKDVLKIKPVKMYPQKLHQALTPSDDFLLAVLKVLADLERKPATPLRQIFDEFTSGEWLEDMARFYPAAKQKRSIAEKRSYIEQIRGVSDAENPSIFLLDTKQEFTDLLQKPGFQESLQEKSENVWFICLDTGIAAIIKSDVDKYFLDEEDVVETTEVEALPISVTIRFKNGSKLIDEVTTNAQLSQTSYMDEIRKIIQEEAENLDITITELNFVLRNEEGFIIFSIEDLEAIVVDVSPAMKKTPEHKWENVKQEPEKFRSRLYKNQNIVARTLFERFEKIIGADKLDKFDTLHVCVATAKYATLRDQTKKRINNFGLRECSTDSVWLYDKSKKIKPNAEFKKKVLEDDKCLFILIADEAHWGYTASGANSQFINDPDLLNRENFFVLLVTATPYNILTHHSRLPERYFLREALPEFNLKAGDLITVRDFDARQKRVTIELPPNKQNTNNNQIPSVPIEKLDFERGELHVVDWTSTVESAKMEFHPDDERYPDGHKYYGLNHFLKHAKSSVRSDEIFENLIQSVNPVSKPNDLAVLLADYTFSMLFAKYFFERDGKILIPASDEERRQVAIQENFNKLYDEIYGDSKIYQVVNQIRDVANFFVRKTVSYKNSVSKDDFASFCNKKLEALQQRVDHNYFWTETDQLIFSFLEKASRQEGTMKLIRIGETPGQKKQVKGVLYGDNFVKKLERIQKLLGWQHTFAICPDFGNLKLHQQFPREYYDLLQQKYHCTHSTKREVSCAYNCKKYIPRKKKTCKTCGHAHKKLQSYEDLGDIPVLLILVDKGRLGDTFPKSMDCLDLRLRHRNSGGYISAAVQELGRMCRYAASETELPYSLISKTFREYIKPNEDSSVINPPAVTHFQKLTPDSYMTPGKIVALENVSITFQWRRQFYAKEDTASPGNSSMDYSENRHPTHPRRLLLMAEPQIGKTEVYLRFWEMIEQRIDGFEIVQPPEPSYIGDAINEDTCLLPYWKCLEKSNIKFHQLSWGKYHPMVFKRRSKILLKALKEQGEPVKYYVETIKREERVDTVMGRQKLNELLAKPLPPSPVGTINTADALKYINWDGFFDKCTERIVTKFKMLSNTTATQIEAYTELWENSKRLLTKPVKCFGRHKIALPASLLPGQGCDKCQPGPIEKPTEKSFTFEKISRLKVEVVGDVQVSIPSAHLELWKSLNDNRAQLNLHTKYHFVFTPSYRVSSGQAVPEKALLDYSHATNTPVLQFIVVRKAMFKDYCLAWGNQRFIVALPDVMVVHGIKEDVVSGSIGYARLFIQLFAYELGLDWVHVWDDNVQKCWKINFKTKKMEETYFDEIMDRFRELSTPKQDTVVRVANSNKFGPINGQDPDVQYPAKKGTKDRITSTNELYAFSTNEIAIIGMGRWHRSQFKAKFPFQERIVYSAVYLNVKDTVKAGCFYPCKPVMEDIDFQHLCLEKKMHVIKMKQYIHTKLNWTPNFELIRAKRREFVDYSPYFLLAPTNVTEEDNANLFDEWLQAFRDDKSTCFVTGNRKVKKETFDLEFIRFDQFSPTQMAEVSQVVFVYRIDEALRFDLASWMESNFKNLPRNIKKIYWVAPVEKMKYYPVGSTFESYRVTSVKCRPPQDNTLFYNRESQRDVLIVETKRLVEQEPIDVETLDLAEV